MMFLKKYINTVSQEPTIAVAGLSVFFLSVMGTSVRHVSSVVFSVLFLLSLSVIKDWRKIYISLSMLEKIFLMAFFLYTASAILSFYNVSDVDKYYKLFERYLRFTLIVPVYFFFIKKNISILNYLYTGAVISGFFLFTLALQHYISNPDVPAKGYYHHIIFGQLAMLNVGIMLSMLLTKVLDNKVRSVIFASILCGLTAAVMSQARGVWLVFPIYVSIVVYYAIRDHRINKKYISVFLAAIVLLSILTPMGDVIKQRTEEAVSEVTRFYVEDQYVSSIGTRLAMWEVAIDVWKRHPLLGTGPGDFDDEIVMLQSEGEYRGMAVHNSVHNIYFQSLVDLGVIGLLALLFVLLVVPFKLFLKGINVDREGRLVGLVTVISFAVFGLSESWTLRMSAISVFLVYMIIIASHIHVVVSNIKDK